MESQANSIGTVPPARSLGDKLNLTSTLKLTSEQSQRLNLFGHIANSRQSRTATHSPKFNPAWLGPNRPGIVEINSEWSADAQLMWQAESLPNSGAEYSVADPSLTPETATGNDVPTPSPLAIERAIVFPDRVGDSDAQIRFSRQLIRHGQNTAAELFVQAC